MGPGGLPESLFFGLLSTPFVAPIIGAAFWVVFFVIGLIARRQIPFNVVRITAACIGIALLLYGSWQHMPAHQFAEHVMSPVPDSVLHLEVGRSTSFSDGSAWFFGFDIDPADFDKLVRARSLVEKPIDWKAHADEARLMEQEDTPERSPTFDQERAMCAWDGYKQKVGSRVFIGNRVVAVADPDLRHVQVLIDYWRYSNTPREP